MRALDLELDPIVKSVRPPLHMRANIPFPAKVTRIDLTWCTKTSTGGSSATPARAVMDRKPNPMRTLNHLQMPAPCSSCGSSAARAASSGASSGAFAQPPGDWEGAQLGAHGIGGPSQRLGWETRVSSPRENTQEAAITKQPAIKRPVPAASRAPQAYTERPVVPRKFCFSSHNTLPGDRPPDRPLLFSPPALVALVCTPLGTPGFLAPEMTH